MLKTRSTKTKSSRTIVPTLEAVEAKLGPAQTWAGNCFAIASACVKFGLIKGVAVYGHWTGPVSSNSYFADRAGFPFVRHGWVVVSPNLIFDPTRWSLTGEKPYLYLGPNNGEYDEGGNKILLMHQVPPPKFDRNSPKVYSFTQEILDGEPWSHVEKLLGPEYPIDLGESRNPGDLTADQVRWIANLAYDTLQPYARKIYSAISSCGLRAFIPIDNFRRAEREAQP